MEDFFWPSPGSPGCRKLSLAGTIITRKIRFLAPPRTHTGGQKRRPGQPVMIG